MVRLRSFGGIVAGAALAASFGSVALSSSAAATQRADEAKVVLEGGQTLFVMAPVYHRNLAIFPVRSLPFGSGERYITLDEGLKTGVVEVREAGVTPPPLVRPRPPVRGQVRAQEPQSAGIQQREQVVQSSGGQVNRLVLLNHSNRKLLLIAGEMVVGGKQDRIVQKDAIIPPNDKPYDLDVFCVEHGRWSDSDGKFRAAALPGVGGGGAGGLGGGIADPAVRGAAQTKAEQQAVWDEVGKKNTQLGGAGSATYQTARRLAIGRGEDKPYAQDLLHKVPGKDVVGAIVAVNGKLIWIDQFSSSALFGSYWPKLLQSYILEALTTRPAKDIEDRIRWKLPTVQEAAAYLKDRSGNARFEGMEGVYKLTRIESAKHVIYELTDIDAKVDERVHVCKVEKK